MANTRMGASRIRRNPWKGKKHAPDSPRYKALGNSMAVPVMRWIGEGIQLVEDNKGLFQENPSEQ